MESLWLLIALTILFTTFAIVTATKEWRRAIPFGVGALALFAGVVVSGLMVMTNKPSSPTPSAGPTGKDFYQVMWEGKTTNGKTVVVVQDISGKFYVSRFNEPLGVKEILVVEKERFQPLLSEKPEGVQTHQE